jgi:hypothetical protein
MSFRPAYPDDADRGGRPSACQGKDGFSGHGRRLAQRGLQANSLPSPTSGWTHPS